jgi:hypothetical protein
MYLVSAPDTPYCVQTTLQAHPPLFNARSPSPGFPSACRPRTRLSRHFPPWEPRAVCWNPPPSRSPMTSCTTCAAMTSFRY